MITILFCVIAAVIGTPCLLIGVCIGQDRERRRARKDELDINPALRGRWS